MNGTIASLIEAGYLLGEDKERLCVDRHKVQRFKKKILGKSTETDQNLIVKGLFLDGRKDNTLILEKTNKKTGRIHQRIRKENHVSVTMEPSGDYITHFTPPPKTTSIKPAKQVAISLHSWLKKNNIDTTLEVNN